MSFKMDVKADFKQVEKMLNDIPGAAERATRRALNKTIKSVESAAVKHLAKDISITQKEARRYIKLHKADYNIRRAVIEASGSRIPIAKLKARQIGSRKKLRDSRGRYKMRKSSSLSAGVKYKGQNGKWKTIPGAFIAEMKSGYVGAFKRTSVDRLPIKELFGPSVPHVFLKRESMRGMIAVSYERWSKNINHEMRFELMRRGY